MMKILFVLISIAFILNIKLYGQANFVEGYVITNNLDTLYGLIDYQQWDENPTEIAFKSRQGGEINYYPMQIQAFYVAGDYYESKRVSINKTSLKTNELPYSPIASYEIEPAFVMPLIKGRINLYYLKDQDARTHFFIQKDTSKLETLRYHKYFGTVKGKRVIVENMDYKNQLVNYLHECTAVQGKVNQTKYLKADLHELIVQYHECISEQYQNYVKPYPKEQIHQFSAIAGISYSSMFFKRNSDVLNEIDFSYSLRPTFGLTYSYFIPRNRQRVSLYNDLLYRSYHIQGNFKDIGNEDRYRLYHSEFKMHYLQLTNLVRYYYVKEEVKPFINAGIATGLALKGHNSISLEEKYYQSINVTEEPAIEGVRRREHSLVIGAGVSYQRFTGEMRYQRSNGLSPYPSLISTGNAFYSLISYRF